MSCPHLKEVVMLYCQAYPVRKMVPLDRLASASPCVGGDFEKCPLFHELSCPLDGRTEHQRDERPADRDELRPTRPTET